jgi:microcompartment protein CcmK/EutM
MTQMPIVEEAPLDAGKLEQFVFRAVDEVGATLNAALVVIATGSASTARSRAPAR